MNDPITNFEFGKRQHREYEAQAGCQWKTGDTDSDREPRSKAAKRMWVIGSMLVVILTGVVVLLR